MNILARAAAVVLILAGLLILFCWKTGFELDFLFHPKEAFNVVVIDAGHGGTDAGAIADGHREKTLTLQMAAVLADELAAHGFKVVMTREDDENISLSERVQIGRRARNAIFVSLHFNHAANREAAGVETFFHDPRKPEFAAVPDPEAEPVEFIEPSESEVLAGFIQSRMLAAVNAPNRGIKNRAFYVLRNASHPAVLVEGGFMSNAMELQLLLNEGYIERLAISVREGILDYHSHVVRSRPLRPQG